MLAVLLTAAALGRIEPLPALAVEASEMLADPALEARARALTSEFRCLVCQNESIDESNAQLAHDLRVLIREQVKAGRSNAQIRDFLVARYGQFVLLKPRLDAQTLLLWLGPFLILGAGAIASVMGLRRARTRSAGEAPLTAAEKNRLAALTEAAAVGTLAGSPPGTGQDKKPGSTVASR
ncbi:MAG: cytochrome c-type biogenesis protein [Hyphomicrobiales bacterium]